MSFKVATRFTLDSGNVDFYDGEMCQVVEIPEQDIIVHKSQQSYVTVKIYDTQYKAWKLTISDENYDTQSRLLQVINEEDEMTFYPHYQYNSATSYNVILMPDEVKKVYTFGEREALLQTTFNLLESSK